MDDATQPHQPVGQASDAQALIDFLAERDVPCPACGYNLRQLRGQTCPECGRGLLLQIGVAKLSNIWITALVGALLPAGCGIPFYILLLFALSQGASLMDIVNEPIGVIFLLLVFYTLCCVVFSILLLVMRQRFMRLRVNAQRGIASALVIGAVVAGIIALSLLGSL